MGTARRTAAAGRKVRKSAGRAGVKAGRAPATKKVAKKVTKKVAKSKPKKAAAKKKVGKKKPAKKAAKRKPAKKATAKNSAKKRPTKKVERNANAPAARTAALTPERKRTVARLRELVMAAIPDAVEKLRFRMPVFSRGGDLCYVGWSPTGVTLGFFRGSELDDPSGLLQGVGKRVRYVAIPDGEAVPEVPIRDLLNRAAVRGGGR